MERLLEAKKNYLDIQVYPICDGRYFPTIVSPWRFMVVGNHYWSGKINFMGQKWECMYCLTAQPLIESRTTPGPSQILKV